MSRSQRNWRDAPADRSSNGGGSISDAEGDEIRRVLREQAPTIEDREHEAERRERIERLRAKRHQ